MAATLLKNKIKQVYGQHCYSHYEERGAKETEEDLDAGALQVLQENLPTLMVTSPKPFADQYLEMISLMGKRWVQEEWPSLIPVSLSLSLTRSLRP